MSFDISLRVPACQCCLRQEEIIDVADPTYNLAPMWREAFAAEQGIRTLHLANARTAVVPLQQAIERMRADPERYRKLEPVNGWGDYQGAVEVLERLVVKCHAYPTAMVLIT